MHRNAPPDDISLALALDFIEPAVLRRDRSTLVFRLSRTVLRRRIINRGRDCRLFRTGLDDRPWMYRGYNKIARGDTLFPRKERNDGSREKNLAVFVKHHRSCKTIIRRRLWRRPPTKSIRIVSLMISQSAIVENRRKPNEEDSGSTPAAGTVERRARRKRA